MEELNEENKELILVYAVKLNGWCMAFPSGGDSIKGMIIGEPGYIKYVLAELNKTEQYEVIKPEIKEEP